MTSLFKTPKMPAAPEIEKPRSVRMPVENDANARAAAARTRQGAMMRQGRLSTILTDQTKATTGSSGQKLGA